MGDYINSKANASTTLKDRKRKGNGILADIRAILEEIPLGNRRLETGLLLREAWFINGTMYNSEVWGSFTKADLNSLEILDRKILKLILGSHCKSQSEMLFLETAALPLSYILSIRRLGYLQTLLRRDEKEITKRIFRTQMKNPISGDWALLFQQDINKCEIEMDENKISQMDAQSFKNMVKSKVRKIAFSELSIIQQKHTKVQNIHYSGLSAPQEYLMSTTFTNKKRQLF